MKKASKSDMDTLDRCLSGICNGDDRARQQFEIIVFERCCPEVDAIKTLSGQVKFGVKMQNHALKELTLAADKGNLHASAVVAYIHIYSLGVKNSTANIKRGLEQLKEAKLADNAFANFYLGYCYLYGITNYKQFETSTQTAIKYFEKASSLGCSASIYHLGRMHENGCGFDKNQVVANQYFRQAAEKGSPQGLYKLCVKGDLPNLIPFYLYMPKNLDLICEIGVNKLAKVEGNAYYVETKHVANSTLVSITYSGNLPIDKNVIETKLTSLNGFPLDRQEWDVQMMSYTRGGVKFTAGDSSDNRQKLYNYQYALVLANLIQQADDIIADRILSYQKQQGNPHTTITHGQTANNNNLSSLPGFFSAPQSQSPTPSNVASHANTPAAAPTSALDPATTLEIMQMLQNNPQFASQVAQLFHQYKAYYSSQMK